MRLECQNDLEMVEMKLSRIGYLDGMMEWCWNEGDFKIKGFALVKKSPFISPHSIISTSFLNDKTASNDVQMNGMILKWYISIVFFIPCYS